MLFRRSKRPTNDPRELEAQKAKKELVAVAQKAARNTKKVNVLLDDTSDSVALKWFLATGGARRTK